MVTEKYLNRLYINTVLFTDIVVRMKITLSYDIASGSEITPCNKINKQLVFYTFTGNVMTSITTLRT